MAAYTAPTFVETAIRLAQVTRAKSFVLTRTGVDGGLVYDSSTVDQPGVVAITGDAALALEKMFAAYPTAGALYHWSAILGGNGWGFATAWLNTLGQFAITAGIDYGLALFVVDTLGLEPSRAQILGVYGAILTSHAILNHVGVRAVAVLNWLSAWYHIVGVALLVVALLWRAPTAS